MPAIRIWLPSVRYFGKRKNTAMGRSQKAISSLAHFCEGRLFMRVSSPVASYASPRQPAREQQQQDDHRDVNDEGSDLRRVIFAGDVEHAEYQRGDQRALDCAGPANPGWLPSDARIWATKQVRSMSQVSASVIATTTAMRKSRYEPRSRPRT